LKFLILQGSTRPNGNTAELCKPFIEELTQLGAKVETINLIDKKVGDCLTCYTCQQVSETFGCKQDDDMQLIETSMEQADCIVLATPIYSWYCPATMKAVLDRSVYGMNKYYGLGKGSLWAGKAIAIILTHGYDSAYATEPFELGIKRLCEHSKLNYIGMYSVRDEDNLASFQTEQAVQGARNFALEIWSGLSTTPTKLY